MSYRDEKYELTSHIDKILEGIDGFRNAARERVLSFGDFEASHLDELNEIRKGLDDLQLVLTELKIETW